MSLLRIEPSDASAGVFLVPKEAIVPTAERWGDILCHFAPRFTESMRAVALGHAKKQSDHAQEPKQNAIALARMMRCILRYEYGCLDMVARGYASRIIVPASALETWTQFCDWCERSGGFTIHEAPHA